jgi:phosphorylase kinase alpha/beta subunit
MTPLENKSRLHYEPAELQVFDNIECEWPLFFAFLILDGIFRGDSEQVRFRLYRGIIVVARCTGLTRAALEYCSGIFF